MYCAHDTAEHRGITGLKPREVSFGQVLVFLTKQLVLFEVFQAIFASLLVCVTPFICAVMQMLLQSVCWELLSNTWQQQK